MVFQGVLTNDGDGSYTGILPMITGSGFDIYAKDGANAVFTDAGPVIVNQLISNHDAWPSWNVDTPDWYQYSVEFEGTTWSIRNHAGATAEDPWYNDGGDGTDMAKGVPMSGSIEWNNMYASENDLGAYITGTGTAEIDDGLGGAGAWDMDWSGGSEYVPLEYPGFYVNVYSFGDGTYRVTFTPAVSDYVPSEVYVDNNDPTCNGQSPCFSSIQDAIDAVAIGGTVNVAAGTYHENVVIDKQVTIEGEDKTTTIIDGGSSGNVIEITADNAEISGFTIQNSGSDLSHIISNEAAGIALGEVSGVVVEDNIIKGNFAGIGLTGSTGNDINSNTFINNLFGIYIGSDSAPSTANVIERNDISGSIHSDIAVPGKDPIHTGDAIYLDKNCNSNTIEYNTLTGNGQNGIYAWKSGSHIIRGNTINNNQNGIQLMGSSTNTISDNTVSENSEAGLLLRSGVLSSTGSTITENSFLENAVGIVLEDDIGTSNPQSGYVDGNQINFNIIDSTIAVQTVNTPDVVYNFEENFWGESNPDFTSIISNTSKVDYTPWYLDSVMVQLSGQPTCTPGDGQEMACGITLGVCVSGTKSRTCMEDGTWGDWSTCGGINYIPAGNEGTSYDGTCLNGQDDDCDGLTDLEDSDCSYTKTIGDLRSSKSGSDGASLIGIILIGLFRQ
jgi:parallel beta-helix repeat protein